ncbi:uncharacterized protein LOC116266113 [Nymphaea colorata]|nr:uncharacterized protein LOC116266113 [Nymphaea colorata]
MALKLPAHQFSAFSHPKTNSYRSLFPPTTIVRATAAAETSTKRKGRKKKDAAAKEDSVSAAADERRLRFVFMEELMQRAREGDTAGTNAIIYDMIAAGLSPGPHSFHGLVVAQVLSGDEYGAMQSLRRELSAGIRPLHQTFVALIRLFASRGHAVRGQEILAAMEKLNFDIRQPWIILVEELVRNGFLEDANKVFLKGAEGGLRATDELYDLLIQEDCKAGDHSNALTIAYEMEAAGRMATTFHFNCLLSVQANCGIPEIAFSTFENMEYGEDFMKPDTETYNLVIQAYTRAESYDRVQDVAELLGMMVEDHKRLQPNVRTYAILVECFTKYCVIKEAIRHFHALKTFPGGTKVLYNEGNFGDPLSLLLRALCREGRIVELLEALEAMVRDEQPIPPRAMILNRKYRTLVSSWIEPLNEEAELGFEIDYIARYIEEGGLTGDRKRWVPRRGKTPLDPDAIGFIYSSPIEISFKQRCLEDWKTYHRKILKKLRFEGGAAFGSDVSESDVLRVEERLKKIIKGPDQNALKPKAASKMIVSELREELEAQGLPTDGTRQVLYQRVQKARRINRSRGRPLWVPPVEEEEEEVDEEVDELISRIKLEEGNTEFWKRRFLGEGLDHIYGKQSTVVDSDSSDILDDLDAAEDGTKEVEDDEVEEEEEEPPESQLVDRVKDKEVEAKKPPEMIGVQLLKDSDQTPVATNKAVEKKSQVPAQDSDDEDWFPLDLHDAFKMMRERKVFDVTDMYTIADAWGWTWEKELKAKVPEKWSQEREVDLAIKIMSKVIELGGRPTIGDCAMILRSAIRAPLPSTFLTILQTTHGLGYVFGRPLYDEVITLCLDLGELDLTVAIVAELETAGIKVPDETLDSVLAAQQIEPVGNAEESDNLS